MSPSIASAPEDVIVALDIDGVVSPAVILDALPNLQKQTPGLHWEVRVEESGESLVTIDHSNQSEGASENEPDKQPRTVTHEEGKTYAGPHPLALRLRAGPRPGPLPSV